MTTRDDKVAAEAAALWREVFGGLAPPEADATSLLEAITAALPDVRYDRIRSPFLRPSMISHPRGDGERA